MTVDAQLMAISEQLGTSLDQAWRFPWGDANATWRLRLADGRDVIARRFAAGRGNDARRLAANMTAAARGGLPVPDPQLIAIGKTPWLITNRVDGRVGSDWLDTRARARTLAGAMAQTRRELLKIDRSAAVQLVPLRDVDRSRLDLPARDALEIAEAILSRRRFDAVFVHGDFAPINVVVDGACHVSALLDFEHAHVGDPLEDVAWWSWVVRHHHPDAWRASWSTFCDLAGVDRVADGPIIHALMVKELARRAAGVRGAHNRDRWLGRLVEAVAWRP